jgi:translation initiation factor IF-2
VVIEANKTTGMGPIATILVTQGRLKIGDYVVLGTVFGRVRAMFDDNGKSKTEAKPSDPVRIAGLSAVPEFGELLTIAQSEKDARDQARQNAVKSSSLNLGNLEVEGTNLPLIIKADVDGSLKAISSAIATIKLEDVSINIIKQSVGDITESDINMAMASRAMVVGFRVKINPVAQKNASNNNIVAKNYDVIYDLIDEITAAAKGSLEKELVEVEIGRLKVLQIFRRTKNQKIIGGKVNQGKIVPKAKVTLFRAGIEIGSGEINSLQRGQQQVPEVGESDECGLGIDIKHDIEPNDILVISELQEQIVRSKKEPDDSNE